VRALVLSAWAFASASAVAIGPLAAQEILKTAADLERECSEGRAAACTRVGVQFAFGTQGRQRDYQKARGFLEKGCAGRDANGCKELGVLYEYGRGVPKNPGEALRLYKIGCQGGVALACQYAARLAR